MLQCVAVFCSYLSNWAAMEEASADNQRAAVAAVAPASVVHLSSITYVLQSVAVCCGVLQCVAVCCSVLQCVAVCCSVLQRDAVAADSLVPPSCILYGCVMSHIGTNHVKHLDVLGTRYQVIAAVNHSIETRLIMM